MIDSIKSEDLVPYNEIEPNLVLKTSTRYELIDLVKITKECRYFSLFVDVCNGELITKILRDARTNTCYIFHSHKGVNKDTLYELVYIAK